MSSDEMLRFILPLQREDRKKLLNHLIEEMRQEDLEEVLKVNGYESTSA